MDLYLLLKWAHILSAAVLFGTGMGIAFFMLAAHRTQDPVLIAGTGRFVVQADYVFTATAVVFQPLSGLALMHLAGYGFWEGWLIVSYTLYLLVGCCWLPVVRIQWRMQRLAQDAADMDCDLPHEYHRLFRWWFSLGWPAFAGVLAIYWLMMARPTLFGDM
ncbi:DUF2269 family protein [Pyruvatibacter mobilis]|uniref:DUF2269 family protein n=1 Tax=Pyruvatibacter mobilis TaxID=1712261 RepID=UPI003D0DA54A